MGVRDPKIQMDVSGPPVTTSALKACHMTSVRWQTFGNLDFEVRPKPVVWRYPRFRRGSCDWDHPNVKVELVNKWSVPLEDGRYPRTSRNNH